MNPFKILKHQLYLIQLENYDLSRFLRLISKQVLPATQPDRKEIVWTPKLRGVFGLAIFLQFLVALGSAWYFDSLYVSLTVFIIFFILLSVLFFIFLALAVLLIWPFDRLAKKIIISKAKRKISRLPGLKIIGITGSYGKTTMKEALATILGQKFRVLKTSENINTPVGISRLILKELNEDIQILIVEMGAYQKGDIQALCEITPPNIAILTGINEAHLERFGSLENIISTKFEIVENLLPGGIATLNIDDREVAKNYLRYINDKTLLTYSSRQTIQYEFFTDGSGQKFTLPGRGSSNEQNLTFHVKHLGEYIIGVIDASTQIGVLLGLNAAQIVAGTAQVRPVSHRLKPIPTSGGVLVIDDSYNGNPAGVRESLKTLSKFENRRKVFITPGLVEMSEKTKPIHEEIGFLLGQTADVVILIRNSVTPFIAEGLKRAGFSERNLKWFETAPEAHASMSDIIRPGDVVLFQNDWPDNYV